MKSNDRYHIGTLGSPWGNDEMAAWLAAQSVKRSYADEVVAKIDAMRSDYEVVAHGELSIDPARYPLFVLKSRSWEPSRPSVFITGGVHGYETSGVQGAIRFLQVEAHNLAEQFNFMVMPCVSPWGYETINRWNPRSVDPNRSFKVDSPSEEAAAVIRYLEISEIDFVAHFDLHETTDTDNSEFRPALAARDAVQHDIWEIPDGFYAVGDRARPVPEFQKAIIESVKQVTHIAPGINGEIIGEPLEQEGVINYDAGPLGLCMGATNARFVTTTEVYPDSPRATDEICIDAQVATIRGGLHYVCQVSTSEE
ncbi:MAG: M14 family metallocarboxypeptidase [Planctomycetota bacterium]